MDDEQRWLRLRLLLPAVDLVRVIPRAVVAGELVASGLIEPALA
jgi:hypothetical protein